MILCDFCLKDITEIVYSSGRRHYSKGTWPRRIYCDRVCRAQHEKQSGFLKEISLKGREARSRAVALSNHTNPRRRQRGVQERSYAMTATQLAIRNWLHRGKRKGATHVIVVCDTFDWMDYPVYVPPEQDIQTRLTEIGQAEMQTVLEVYNLALPLEPQLTEQRAWNL